MNFIDLEVLKKTLQPALTNVLRGDTVASVMETVLSPEELERIQGRVVEDCIDTIVASLKQTLVLGAKRKQPVHVNEQLTDGDEKTVGPTKKKSPLSQSCSFNRFMEEKKGVFPCMGVTELYNTCSRMWNSLPMEHRKQYSTRAAANPQVASKKIETKDTVKKEPVWAVGAVEAPKTTKTMKEPAEAPKTTKHVPVLEEDTDAQKEAEAKRVLFECIGGIPDTPPTDEDIETIKRIKAAQEAAKKQ